MSKTDALLRLGQIAILSGTMSREWVPLRPEYSGAADGDPIHHESFDASAKRPELSHYGLASICNHVGVPRGYAGSLPAFILAACAQLGEGQER